MKTLLHIALFAVVASSLAFGMYLLGGGEQNCFRQLGVNEHPLTCAVGFELIFDVTYGIVSAGILVPVWLYLRAKSRSTVLRKRPALLCCALPVAFGALVVFLRWPHIAHWQAIWEGLCLAAPPSLAIIAVAGFARGFVPKVRPEHA